MYAAPRGALPSVSFLLDRGLRLRVEARLSSDDASVLDLDGVVLKVPVEEAPSESLLVSLADPSSNDFWPEARDAHGPPVRRAPALRGLLGHSAEARNARPSSERPLLADVEDAILRDDPTLLGERVDASLICVNLGTAGGTGLAATAALMSSFSSGTIDGGPLGVSCLERVAVAEGATACSWLNAAAARAGAFISSPTLMLGLGMSPAQLGSALKLLLLQDFGEAGLLQGGAVKISFTVVLDFRINPAARELSSKSSLFGGREEDAALLEATRRARTLGSEVDRAHECDEALALGTSLCSRARRARTSRYASSTFRIRSSTAGATPKAAALSSAVNSLKFLLCSVTPCRAITSEVVAARLGSPPMLAIQLASSSCALCKV